jgi:hypothetical protein
MIAPSLSICRLYVYEVAAPTGDGTSGRVARDRKLNRNVARCLMIVG